MYMIAYRNITGSLDKCFNMIGVGVVDNVVFVGVVVVVVVVVVVILYPS